MHKEISPLRRHIADSPKLQALRKKRYSARRRVLILFSIFFVVLVVGFVYASRHPKFQITQITVSGNQVTETEEIVSHTEKFLSGNYVYVIPRRNTFLYPKDDILFGLQQSFPRLRDITIERVHLNTLAITATEVRGDALWCGMDIQSLQMDAPCYFTDAHGVIVAPAPYYSGNVYLRFFGGPLLDADTDPLGRSFISEKKFQKLLVFKTEIEKLGFEVKAVRLGPMNEYSFILHVGQGREAAMRFLAEDDYVKIVSNLSAAMSRPELSASLRDNKSNLEYFDLRFTNKVYYRFKQ
jgi:hypothetical protein